MVLSRISQAAVLANLLGAATAGESPVAKVIKLLQDLKKEVETEGGKEATAYGTFACFCKDTTKKKSDSVTSENDKIGTLSADIMDGTASKTAKQAEVKERKQTHTQLGEDLSAAVARCSTAQARYEADTADMTKAIESLNKAIKAMSAKKGKMKAAALIAEDKDVQNALALAKAKLDLDPSDPAYKYHSKEINNILADLLKDFTSQKKDIADKWSKTSSACTEEKDGLNKKMKANLEATSKAEEKIEELSKQIAKDRGDLVKSQETMQDDEAYLKDLTSQCEAKAKDFDQRASMRNDEIQALSQALKIIGDKVESADKDVNKRAFVQQHTVQVSPHQHLSLIQTSPTKKTANFLAAKSEVSTQERLLQEQVVSLLRHEGSRLASPELSAVAMSITADHFKKVKAIIQGLIERLLDESRAEADKKGFCDTEIGKAKENRDNAHQHTQSMSAELKQLEATKEELEAEIKQLQKDVAEAQKELKKAADLRGKEKDENTESMQTAQDGLNALNEAILILKSFYSQASRASFLQASPVDDDTSGPGFGGNYKGKQKSSRAIFALLETIASDFQRTLSKTEQAEADAAAAFVKFDRTSKENIGSKETKIKMDEQDLKSTKTNIDKTLDDLETETGLLDDALKMIESLKPACLDAGGMNYKERVSKRNEEIAALKKAICILTPGKKEGDCK